MLDNDLIILKTRKPRKKEHSFPIWAITLNRSMPSEEMFFFYNWEKWQNCHRFTIPYKLMCLDTDCQRLVISPKKTTKYDIFPLGGTYHNYKIILPPEPD